MKLVAWNILHGGGPMRTPRIALHLAELDPDVVVLTEYRRTTGGQIAGVLFDRGLCHQLSTDPARGKNGVFIAARTPIEPGTQAPDDSFKDRWLDVRLCESNSWLTGIHAPDTRRCDARGLQRQASYWQHLVALAESRKQERMIIAGDLNTGRHRLDEAGETFAGSWYLGRLSTMGYRDAYRLLEPCKHAATWSSHSGSGFRIDAVWVSQTLRNSVRSAWHGNRCKDEKASDHTSVIVEFEGVFQGLFDVSKARNAKNTAKQGSAPLPNR